LRFRRCCEGCVFGPKTSTLEGGCKEPGTTKETAKKDEHMVGSKSMRGMIKKRSRFFQEKEVEDEGKGGKIGYYPPKACRIKDQ